MALRYEYDEVIGHCIVNSNNEKITLTLYEGNAFLIAVRDLHDKEGKTGDQLHWFFADKEHAKNCLGLTKGYDNIFDEGYFDSFIFDNPQNSRYLTDIIKLFLRAIPDIKIIIN